MSLNRSESPLTKGRKVVYILERFPADTLNFVYNEIEVLEGSGFEIDIFSLLPCVFCPADAAEFRDRTVAIKPVAAIGLVRSFLYFLTKSPLKLLSLLLVLPFENRNGFWRKFPRTLSHLVYGVHFAYLLRGRSDHVHAHFAYKAATAALCASRLNGNTFSFTAHGSASIHPPSQFSLRSKIRGSAFVVAVSEYNKRVLLEACPDYDPDRIVVNRTGIMIEDFRFAPPQRNPQGPFRILCVASLYPIKNHECLIDACGQLAANGLDFRLTLVGKDEGRRREALEARARTMGIQDRIVFHGVADHKHVSEMLKEADLFILTSHSEGVPVAMMEAMATGLPVLGPRVTGLPELVEDKVTGWLADPRVPGEFAEIMERIIVDPNRIEPVLEPARETIETVYNMKANARLLAGIFWKMLPAQP